MSPSLLRAKKAAKVKDEHMYEKVQIMIKAELSAMRASFEKEVCTSMEAHRVNLYNVLKGEMQQFVRAEVQIAQVLWQQELNKATDTWEAWKSEMQKSISEKDATIEALRKEIASCKSKTNDNEENQPSVVEELKNIKEQVKTLQEDEQQKTREASSWADILTRTQKKVDEAEKWIEVAKKGKGGVHGITPSSTIINMTLEEEQKRKTRALHVRITGLKDRDNVEEETKELLLMMGITKPMHTQAWRVGKKSEGDGETSRERALILRFPSMEAKKEFLKKRPTLKKTGIFLGDDLTLAQVAHLKEVMPEIKAAREKGKIAFYRGGRVVILEKRTA